MARKWIVAPRHSKGGPVVIYGGSQLRLVRAREEGASEEDWWGVARNADALVSRCDAGQRV